jgi:hypothetical protein
MLTFCQVRSAGVSDRWKAIKYLVFDLPADTSECTPGCFLDFAVKSFTIPARLLALDPFETRIDNMRAVVTKCAVEHVVMVI